MDEFIVVVDDDIFDSRYAVFVVPDGGGRDSLGRKYIGSAGTMWGVGRIFRKERARRGRGGARIVHREEV